MDDIKINEFDFNLINEYFAGFERQGPGSPEHTIKALGFVGDLSDKTKIADAIFAAARAVGGENRQLAE